MDSAEPPRLRCPDCGKAVGPLVGQPSCQGCGRRFVAEGGVWELLPASRETVNRSLATLCALGWVHRRGRTLVVDDLEAMRRLSRTAA